MARGNLGRVPFLNRSIAMAYEIKELGVGGILDQAIRIVKDHFGLLFGIVAVLFLPFSLLASFVELAMAPTIPDDPTKINLAEVMQAAQQAQLYSAPFYLLNALIISPLTNAAIVFATANLYLGRSASIGESFSRAVKLIIPLLITNILVGLAVFGGLILLIIPGLIFAFWFALSNHVVILEDISGPKALGRSRQLMKGNVGTLIVLGLLVGLIQVALIFGLGMFLPGVLRVIAVDVVIAILVVFFAAVGVVFYFSCRCKAENFDLNMLADAVADGQSADRPSR